MMRTALPQRTIPGTAAPKPRSAALRVAAPAISSPTPARGDESARLAATLSRLEPLPDESPVARTIQRKARAGANAALDVPAEAVVQRMWSGNEDSDPLGQGSNGGPDRSSDEDREFDVVSIKRVGADTEEENAPPQANEVDASAFEDLGSDQPLSSIALVRPVLAGTEHYEVQAMVGGVRVKLDLTSSGFRVIYGASEAGDGYRTDEPTPLVGKTGADLYKVFLRIALANNYNMDRYDCQQFAEQLVREIQSEVAESEVIYQKRKQAVHHDEDFSDLF